jgi:outer membrane cobalamin receptor
MPHIAGRIDDHRCKWMGFSFCLALFLTVLTHGWETAEASDRARIDDTLLMFVGEPLDVLTIATRREESAWQVPAVAHVMTREQFKELGIAKLSEALALVPGFYLSEKENGTQAYLRGIPGSILFLYDTVPLGSEVTKSLQFLDNEVSLTAIKRIEIIRGPGSVLWGPDAFAGVVNIVPLDGHDLQGVETGFLYGEPGQQVGAFSHAGAQSGNWDARISLGARKGEEDDTVCNIVRFWENSDAAVPPEQRIGRIEPDNSYYVEASGRAVYRDWLSFTGWISDFSRSYAMEDPQERNTWSETKSVSSGFVKMEGKYQFQLNSGIRFNGSYRWLNPEYEVIDRTLTQKENSIYAEFLYDRSVLSGNGLFTAGVSYRESRIKNAPIWDGYLPDYLGPENENLVPLLDQVDYETRLTSLFGQYTHTFPGLEILLGVRYDGHNRYEDALSYNAGAVWQPERQWVVKLLHGMAYRTPYALQLREAGSNIKLERIINSSVQVSWKPISELETSLCLFNNRIKNHVMEDPYAGLSNPNTQEITGLEAELSWAPAESFELLANFTVMNNSGPDEIYRYNDFSYIDEETGELVKNFVDLSYPYDIGAKQLLNLIASWRPSDRLRTSATLRYIGPRDLVYPRGETQITCDDVWLVDWGIVFDRFPFSNSSLSLTARNLFDTDYETPGTYSVIDGEPLTVLTTLQLRW